MIVFSLSSLSVALGDHTIATTALIFFGLFKWNLPQHATWDIVGIFVMQQQQQQQQKTAIKKNKPKHLLYTIRGENIAKYNVSGLAISINSVAKYKFRTIALLKIRANVKGIEIGIRNYLRFSLKVNDIIETTFCNWK